MVKSNQAHHASFDLVVDEPIDLDTSGVSIVSYDKLPFKHLSRPIYPLDLDMNWDIYAAPHHSLIVKGLWIWLK